MQVHFQLKEGFAQKKKKLDSWASAGGQEKAGGSPLLAGHQLRKYLSLACFFLIINVSNIQSLDLRLHKYLSFACRAANHYALGVIYHAQENCIRLLRP